MNDEELSEKMAALVASAVALYGEPEYRYFKKVVRWSPREKSHVVGIGDGEEVTREEWELHSVQSQLDEVERFMGRLKRSYWRYERKQNAPAWREKLLALIPNYPK